MTGRRTPPDASDPVAPPPAGDWASGTDAGGTGLGRFVAFVLVGLLNTAVGYGLYALFLRLGLGPQPALALSFCLGVLWNFFAHGRFVFATRGLGRLPHYIAVYVAIYLGNAAALAALLGAGVAPLVAQALILPFAVVASFLGVGAALTGRLPFGRPGSRDRRG